MPRKSPDLDFKIHADPSCLSELMDEQESPRPLEGESLEPQAYRQEPAEVEEQPSHLGEEEHLQADEVYEDDHGQEEEEEAMAHDSPEEQPESPETSPEGPHVKILEADAQTDEACIDEDHVDTSIVGEQEDEEHPNEEEHDGCHIEDDHSHLEASEADIGEHSQLDEDDTPEQLGDAAQEPLPGEDMLEMQIEQEGVQSLDEQNVETPKPIDVLESIERDEPSANTSRQSLMSERKTSMRTEALIQAAARAVVAKIERDGHRRQTDSEVDEEGEHSLLSMASEEDGTSHITESYLHDDAQSIESKRDSTGSDLEFEHSHHAHVSDEGGENSSHNEADDDVFSDHSPRSSIGSYDGHADDASIKSESTAHGRRAQQLQQNITYRSPRVSGISELSQYEKEEFVPTSRDTPRPAFRTPSSIRAMQMSSPTPSVFSPPRSNKRHTGLSAGGAGFPTISRLGSPNPLAQYSPKGRTTPSRLKPKQPAPLVLLHATLLPLHWAWGDVLDRLDAVVKDGYEPGEQLKGLREAWRQLHDRLGDTVFERGILLPHPQNDFEVLEERLLEALELPMRRRARILECGHYLGSANEMNVNSDGEESDDGYAPEHETKRLSTVKKHWCQTCRSDIRYEDLGAGRIFRLKVYASNGLMKAGAWEACWREMERVDIEVEPIIEPGVQGELEKVAALQSQEHQRQRQLTQALPLRLMESPLDTQRLLEDHNHLERQENLYATDHQQQIDISSAPLHASPPELPSLTATVDEDRRQREEERLREIYGHTPPHRSSEHGESEEHAQPRHPDSYIPPPSPPSPSEAAFERREDRRRSYQTASLPELLLESVRVLMQDRKNVVIGLLALLILALAVRTAPPLQLPPLNVQIGTSAIESDAELLGSLYSQPRQQLPLQMTESEVSSQVSFATAVPSQQPVLDVGNHQTASAMAALSASPTNSIALADVVTVPILSSVSSISVEELVVQSASSVSSISPVDAAAPSFSSVSSVSIEAVPVPSFSSVNGVSVMDVARTLVSQAPAPPCETVISCDRDAKVEQEARDEVAAIAAAPTVSSRLSSSGRISVETETQTISEKKVVRVCETVTETEIIVVTATTTRTVAAETTPAVVDF